MEHLKKYVTEQLDYNVIDLSERFVIEYAFNYGDSVKTENTALQKVYQFKEFSKDRIGIDYLVLDALVTRSYLLKLLSYLPEYMRKDEYIKAIYKAYENELMEIDSAEQKLERDLNITTSVARLRNFEDEYAIDNRIEYGIIFRRNTVIAKRIAKYLNWNKETINIYSNLFLLGNVSIIENHKENFKQVIILENSISNNYFYESFLSFINEIGPAYYIFEVRGGDM